MSFSLIFIHIFSLFLFHAISISRFWTVILFSLFSHKNSSKIKTKSNATTDIFDLALDGMLNGGWRAHTVGIHAHNVKVYSLLLFPKTQRKQIQRSSFLCIPGVGSVWTQAKTWKHTKNGRTHTKWVKSRHNAKTNVCMYVYKLKNTFWTLWRHSNSSLWAIPSFETNHWLKCICIIYYIEYKRSEYYFFISFRSFSLAFPYFSLTTHSLDFFCSHTYTSVVRSLYNEMLFISPFVSLHTRTCEFCFCRLVEMKFI